jgi:O-antigen ligase
MAIGRAPISSRAAAPSSTNGEESSRKRLALHGALALLLLLLLTAPLPYGSVLPKGHMLIEALSFAAAILAFAARPGGRIFGVASLAVGALLGISALGALQLIPLPPALMAQLAPWSDGVYRGANAILTQFDRPAIAPRVSVAPFSTASVALLTLAYTAAFGAATIVAGSRLRRRILVATLLGTSALHVLVATVTTGAAERVHGSFINPNNFAGYLQIPAAFAFGVLWLEILKNRERGAGWTDIGVRFQKRAVPIALRILLWGIIVAGIGASRSRGGILAAALTVFTLLALVSFQRTMRVRRALMPATLAVIAGLIFVGVSLGKTPLLRFLSSDPREIESDTRVRIWRASLEAFEQAPTFGSGLGTFREAFRHVQPPEVRGLVEHAHSDFLQMLVTGGAVGVALSILAAGSLLIVLVHRWAMQVHREESALALGGIGALIALMLHGMVEFNMSIPAIPVTLAVMLGVSWAAANVDSARVRAESR